MAEAFGWRGYALPTFQAKRNALVSSLILGVLWLTWQLPSFFIPGRPLYQRNLLEWAPFIILSVVIYGPQMLVRRREAQAAELELAPQSSEWREMEEV